MMSEDTSRRTDELAALRSGIEAGMTLTDTAEMYCNGAAEELVEGQRDTCSSSARSIRKIARASAARVRRILRRLGTAGAISTLRWRGRVPRAEMVEAMQAL
jgi:aryl-alcohol dehydrogenase-like predicted oxidoreductase